MSRRKQQAPCKVQEAGDGFAVDNAQQPTINGGTFCESLPADSEMAHLDASFTSLQQECAQEDDSMMELEEPLNLSKPKLVSEAEGDDLDSVVMSKEEEHTCGICHKTFMSKYGLLTHAEVHSASELKCSSQQLTHCDSESLNNHSATLHKIKHISGFSELSSIDFTCKKFPAISEVICSKSLLRLTDRDSSFFFLCKSCDRLFPSLSSLSCHLIKHRETAEGFQPAAKLEEVSSQSNGESLQTITNFLGLTAKPLNNEKSSASNKLNYSMESANVRTSQSVAALKVPVWMRSGDEECYYDTEMSRDPSERRPALKLKLVRRRPTSDGVKPTIPAKYFVEDDIAAVVEEEIEEKEEEAAKPTSRERVACEACGEFFANEAALAGHKAASICGIGVGPSSNGRRMFWCRLCNYASCEKSTILRHQRTHTGLRPYSCKFCSIAFTTKANCERHIRKRHRVRVSSDVEVKNAVYCDYDLLKKARDGEINIPPTASVSNPAGGKYFSFVCRICKATFTSRNSGARHVMAKHSIMNRKRASEYIHCVRVHEKRAQPERSDNANDERPERLSRMNEAIVDMKQDSNCKPLRTKLIPLLKIRSHYEASLQLAERFCEEYAQVFDELGKIRQDSTSLSAKLLSLLGSASALVEQKDRPSAKFRHNSPDIEDVTDDIENDVAMRDNDVDHFNNDEGLQQSSPDFSVNGNHSSNDSSPPESPFKPWKTTSPALLLRHFAASSSKQPSDLSASTQDFASDLSNPSSRTSIILDTTEPSVNSPQASSNKGLMGWPTSTPKLRDERGRYVRNPNSPHPPRTSQTKTPSSLVPYRSHSDLPTMVPMRGGNVLNLNEKRHSSSNASSNLIGRKCPKCDKIFPWASSLSRHIMTHTGLKPYMCARCSMRFTTRSNLLRHAYRRHGLERGSNERHNVLVTLSLNEQKEHAEKEAQRLARMGEKMEELTEEDQQEKTFDSDENIVKNDKVAAYNSPQPAAESGFYNKRYMCGRCRQPFANRSNLVRHLQRLHRITKDDPEFRNLLVKIHPTLAMKPQQNFALTDGSPKPEESADRSENIETPTESDFSSSFTNGSNDVTPQSSSKLKAFTCSICSIGFTKRNNAARHIQHLHNVSRKSAHFHQLIIRNVESEEGRVVDVAKEESHSLSSTFIKEQQKESGASSPIAKVQSMTVDDEAEHQPEPVPSAAFSEETASLEKKTTWTKAGGLSGTEGGMPDIDESLQGVKPKKKDIRLTHFICGVCKRIFKEVDDLKEHLNEHNIPHPWQCTVCGVPFTNKYNCQRHLVRRHGLTTVDPKYVEDVRHVPKHPRRKGKTFGRRTLQNKIKIVPKLDQSYKLKTDD